MRSHATATFGQRVQVLALVAFLGVSAYFFWLEYSAYRDLSLAMEQGLSSPDARRALASRFGVDTFDPNFVVEVLMDVASHELGQQAALLRNSLLLLVGIWAMALARLSKLPTLPTLRGMLLSWYSAILLFVAILLRLVLG